ncbi:hypothetical protein GCM10022237_45210 [Nocardioides ginsengisoli]|uniref:DoxX family membrane protein n=1 Tax=Nocardioides ginsengisoli TaxID=363868 RepID=A0ABW3W8J7_9ACTN
MTTDSHPVAPPAAHSLVGADGAFLLLRSVFTVAPIAFGVDKFAEILTHWERYLAPWINDLVPGDAHQAMLAVGVIEVVAGVVVAVAPRYGGPLVAVWLAGIIVDLVSTGRYYDIALRDAGLLSAALALTLLAWGRTAASASSRGAR